MKIVITGNMGYVGALLLEQWRCTYPETFLTGIDAGYFAHCLTGETTFPEDRLEFMKFNDNDSRNSQLIRLKVLAGHCEQGRLNSRLEWQ